MKISKTTAAMIGAGAAAVAIAAVVVVMNGPTHPQTQLPVADSVSVDPTSDTPTVVDTSANLSSTDVPTPVQPTTPSATDTTVTVAAPPSTTSAEPSATPTPTSIPAVIEASTPTSLYGQQCTQAQTGQPIPEDGKPNYHLVCMHGNFGPGGTAGWWWVSVTLPLPDTHFPTATKTS